MHIIINALFSPFLSSNWVVIQVETGAQTIIEISLMSVLLYWVYLPEIPALTKEIFSVSQHVIVGHQYIYINIYQSIIASDWFRHLDNQKLEIPDIKYIDLIILHAIIRTAVRMIWQQVCPILVIDLPNYIFIPSISSIYSMYRYVCKWHANSMVKYHIYIT